MKRAMEHTERGLGVYADIVTKGGDTVRVYESSAATEWCLWLDGKHLTFDEAVKVRDAIDNWIEDVKEQQ